MEQFALIFIIITLLIVDLLTIMMVFLLLRKIEKSITILISSSGEIESRITRLEIKNNIL